MTDRTVLTTSRTERTATAALLPVAGAGVGWAVLTWHDAWRATDRLPLRGPAELVDRFDTWLGPWGQDVREALVDGKHLVLVADNGTELARVKTGFGRAALWSAFRAHGYDWAGAA